MKGPAQLATYIAALLVGGGFLVIILAWNGAAERNSLPQQFPYLLSGGLTGLGMVVAGMIVFSVQAARMLTAQRARLMRELNTAMARLVAVSRAVRAGEQAAADPLVAPASASLNGRVEDPAAGGDVEGVDADTAVLAVTAPLEPLPTPRRPGRTKPEPQSPGRPSSGSTRATSASTRAASRRSGAAPASAPAQRKRTPPSQKVVVVGRSSFHDPACRLVADRDDLPSVMRKEAMADGRSPCRICRP